MTVHQASQIIVDQLLQEHGYYAPSHLLLHEGRLLDSHYAQWQAGEIEYLEDCLFGDPDHIRDMLFSARLYADTLKFLCSQRDTDPMARAKLFSRNTQLNECFFTHYQKREDIPQLDLFVDSGASGVINTINQALSENNYKEARRQLEILYERHPDHLLLNQYESLISAAENMCVQYQSGKALIDDIKTRLRALAESCLHANTERYLHPFWRRAGELLEATPFDVSAPEYHVSYTALQSRDWQRVIHSVENEQNRRQHADLLIRHAIACTQLGDLHIAMQSWCELCWRFPQQSEAIDAHAQYELRDLWRRFGELEPELSNDCFPAWLLMIKPALHLHLSVPTAIAEQTIPIQLFRTLHAYAGLPNAQKKPDMQISLRREIQSMQADFLVHLLQAPQ